MNGKRCAIFLGAGKARSGAIRLFYVSITGKAEPYHQYWFWRSRRYGSHSEAKRELEKWLTDWPDAKIVEEKDL